MARVHITILGLIAGFCTTISLIPQVIKIYKTRRTRDISFLMYILFTLGVLLWLTYGIFIREIPIIIANSVTLILCYAVLFAKIRYK